MSSTVILSVIVAASRIRPHHSVVPWTRHGSPRPADLVDQVRAELSCAELYVGRRPPLAQPRDADLFGTAIRALLRERKQIESPAGYLLHARHLAAYHLCAQRITGRRVLELGSNLGYGAAVLGVGRHYVGIDLNVGDVALAARVMAGGRFIAADCQRLPLRHGMFDAVVSLQVIEHVDDRRFLRTIGEMLAPQGRAFITTPDRALRLLPFQRPWNTEHLREYSARSFERLLREFFDDVELLGLTAPEPVMAIERHRVWQNPVRVYLGKIGVPSRVANRLANHFDRPRHPPGAPTETEHYRQRFGVEAFTLSSRLTASTLDFFAVCGRPRATQPSSVDPR